MADWVQLKKESDKYNPDIISILNKTFNTNFKTSNTNDDMYHNCDFYSQEEDKEPIKVSARIRDIKYFKLYGHQITIRQSVVSGNKSELTKIIEGYGDYILYAFGNPETNKIERYLVGDLNLLRTYLKSNNINGINKDNHDGLSSFVAIDVYDIGKDFVIVKGGKA